MNKGSFWLMLWVTGVFGAGAFLVAADSWVLLKTRLQDIADADLEGRAIDFQHFLEAHKDLSSADLGARIAEKYSLESSEDYVKVTEAGGKPIYASSVFSDHPLPVLQADELDRRLYRDYRLGPRRLRLVSELVELPGRAFIVWIGRPIDQEIALQLAVRRSHISYLLISLLFALAGGYWIARRTRSSQA